MPRTGEWERKSGRSHESTRLRRELVDRLERCGWIETAAVRRAFLALPRECFLAEVAEREGLARVYEDTAIFTASDERGVPTSSSSPPSLMASMLERLSLRPGQRVLEIGAGTGCNAALLAKLVGARGQVVSVELDPVTARRARRGLARAGSPASVVRGDGREGWRRGAPYDRIIATASASSVAPAWHEQLRDGGLLELPLRISRSGGQAVVTLRKHGHVLRSEALLQGGFMPLRDVPGGPAAPAPPTLSASEHVDGRSRPLAHLSGAALCGLSAASRQRLLSQALSEPRTRPLGMRALSAELGFYLMVETPGDRFVLVVGWPHRPGVISKDAEGLALLSGGLKTLTRIESRGAGDAERVLRRLVERWKHLGRPTMDDLQIEVTFDASGDSRVELTWGD